MQLLSLSLFLSLGLFCSTGKVYAYSTEPIDAVPFISEFAPSMQLSWHSHANFSYADIGSDYSTAFTTNGFTTANIDYGFPDNYYFHYPFVTGDFDYWIAFSFWSDNGTNNQVVFVPSSLQLRILREGEVSYITCTDFSFLHNDGENTQGFTAIGKLPENFHSSTIQHIRVNGASARVNSGVVKARAFIYQVPKSEAYTLADVIGAIQSQTTTLMSPPQNNLTYEDIDSIVDRVMDKMGVLSYGHTVRSDFVNLWTPTGSTELTLPGFSMNIQNENYEVWKAQKYNLNSLESQFPTLLTALRTITVLVVWIRCLNYIIREGENFFRG